MISAIYLTLFYQYGLNLWDEGVLLNGALRVYKGESVLIDFYGYPPGRYLLSVLMFNLFGIKISVIRIAVLILTATAVPFMFYACIKFMSAPFAILASFLFLIAPAVYYNRFFPIFTIVNIYTLLNYIHKRDTKWYLMLFVVMAITLFFKLEIAAIAFLVTGFIMIALGGRKSVILLFIAGFIGFTMTVFFAGMESSINFYNALVKTHNQWGTPLPQLFSWELWSRPGSSEFFESILFYTPPIIYIITSILLIKGKEKQLSILSVLLFGAFTYGLVIWRAGFDNLIRVLPPAWILGSYLLCLAYRKLINNKIYRILAVLIISVFPVCYSYNILFNYGFYAGSIGELKKNHARLSLPRADVYANPIEAEWIHEIVSFIKQNSFKNDPIFAAPMNPIWYFLTDRKNPTYYEWILPDIFRDVSMERGIVQKLKTTQPALVVCADIPIDNREDRRISNYAPGIYSYITANYRLIKTVGFFDIWQRRPSTKLQIVNYK